MRPVARFTSTMSLGFEDAAESNAVLDVSAASEIIASQSRDCRQVQRRAKIEMTKKRWHSGKMHREELADAYFQTGHRVKEDLHENQRPTILGILPQPRGWDFHEDGCNHSIGFNQPFYPTPDVDLILIGGYRRFGHIEMTIKIGLAPQKYQNRRLLNRHRLSTAVDGFPLDLGIKTLPNCIVVEDKNGGERKGGPKFPSSVQ